MKRLLVLLVLATGVARADVTPGSYTPPRTCRAYYSSSPQPTWDKSQSDLNRYHLSPPAWAKPAPPAAAPAPVYGTQPHLATPQCSPPRVGVTAPDVVLRHIRGW